MKYFNLSKKGTNQYEKKLQRIAGLKPTTWKTINLVLMPLLIPTYMGVTQAKPITYVSPLAMSPSIYTEISQVETKTSEQVMIANYIKEVFKEDAPKAFKVLSCENSKLDPDAVNTAGNHPAGSRDIGVFQINEYWQRTQGKFLFNWKINVEIAHQLFMENGRQFNLWTCGRKLGV